MRLVEKHIIKQSDGRYKELDNLMFLSKNLYNAALYNVRQFYFENKKYLGYYDLQKTFQTNKNVDYYALPCKVSQQTLKMVDQNFKSFFGSLRLKNNKKVRIPKYLDKNGRYNLIYTNQAISLKRKGYVKLSLTNCYVKTNKENIQQVRVFKKNNIITIEVVYLYNEKELKLNNDRYCSIDLGINNLATVSSNVIKPFIINGKPIKSINQFYNKKLSYYKSKLKNRKTSKKINKLTNKRENKIKDYLHKSSRYIVNHLVSNNINTLVIGYNKGWKQDINIGKVNNQKFVNVPFFTFITMLEYKCKIEGINVIINEESYTSKCSFLDDEEICKHDNYLGRRIKRGLFKTSNGIFINADLNGSLNILKKVVGKFSYPIEVCSMPVVITAKFN